MKKMIGAALCVVALVGCGGPLEGEGAETGTTQQAVLTNMEGVPGPGGSQLQVNPLRNPQEAVVRAPAFQEQQHVTDPLHANPCH